MFRCPVFSLSSALRARHFRDIDLQPELADLDSLIEATRQSGARIDVAVLDANGAPAHLAEVAASVPTSTGLTAYRIVQESLSNAVRHSPGADVRVEVRRDSDALRITVENGPASGAIKGVAAPGSGLGLVGLRGRAAALGGSVVAGPDGDGFLLEASLPVA